MSPNSNRIRKVAWLVVSAIVLLTLFILACVYRRHLLNGFDLLAGETGGRMIAALILALALFVLVCGVAWMLFPIFVYLGLRNVRRQLAELDDTAKSCARQLSQLTTDRQSARPTGNGPGEKPTAERPG